MLNIMELAIIRNVRITTELRKITNIPNIPIPYIIVVEGELYDADHDRTTINHKESQPSRAAHLVS